MFAVPGDLDTPTGGYAYDKRMIAELGALGWRVEPLNIGEGFPRPSAATRQKAEALLAAVPAGRPIVIDGLALGVLPDVAARVSARHPLIALIHHPLALETGLEPAEARLLETAERSALALVSRVICTSQWTARTLATYGVPVERIRVVEPGVDRRRWTAHAAVDGLTSRTARAAVESLSRDTPEDHPWGSAPHIPVRRRSRERLSTSTRAVRRDQSSTPTGAAPDAGRSTPRDVRLLCVATVTPRKGHAVLFEALGELRDRRWHLTCAGSTTRDAATFAALEHQVDRLALRTRVSFLGDLDADALEREYQRADLFVLASYLEGYGMALAEAVARGIPVVSTTAGAIPETVPAAAGVLVPPGDSRALAKALAPLLDRDDERASLAANARAAAATLPTWRAAAEKFAAALDGAAPARGARR